MKKKKKKKKAPIECGCLELVTQPLPFVVVVGTPAVAVGFLNAISSSAVAVPELAFVDSAVRPAVAVVW